MVKLSSIQLNDSNPRTIQDEKFALLVNSVLAFPKMMAIRPIVLDGKKVLGGNMRRRALGAIFEMPEAVGRIIPGGCRQGAGRQDVERNPAPAWGQDAH